MESAAQTCARGLGAAVWLPRSAVPSIEAALQSEPHLELIAGSGRKAQTIAYFAATLTRSEGAAIRLTEPTDKQLRGGAVLGEDSGTSRLDSLAWRPASVVASSYCRAGGREGVLRCAQGYFGREPPAPAASPSAREVAAGGDLSELVRFEPTAAILATRNGWGAEPSVPSGRTAVLLLYLPASAGYDEPQILSGALRAKPGSIDGLSATIRPVPPPATYVECAHGFVHLQGLADSSLQPLCARADCREEAVSWYVEAKPWLSAADHKSAMCCAAHTCCWRPAERAQASTPIPSEDRLCAAHVRQMSPREPVTPAVDTVHLLLLRATEVGVAVLCAATAGDDASYSLPWAVVPPSGAAADVAAQLAASLVADSQQLTCFLRPGVACSSVRRSFGARATSYALVVEGPGSSPVTLLTRPGGAAAWTPLSTVASLFFVSEAARQSTHSTLLRSVGLTACRPTNSWGVAPGDLRWRPPHARAAQKMLHKQHEAVRAYLEQLRFAMHLRDPVHPYAPTHVSTVVGVPPGSARAHLPDDMHDAVVASAMSLFDSSGDKVYLDPALVQRLARTACAMSQARGSNVVNPRDLMLAAERLRRADGRQTRPTATPASPPSPADTVPVHHEELSTRLAALRSDVAGRRGRGMRPPRVLVVGETSGQMASMFLAAGADAATCDLQPSEHPSIPHYLGDAANIIDLGWDLVICHPPCTYLSNAGLTWLYQEPSRFSSLLDNAFQFNRMKHAHAPRVAVENSKMHRFGRELTGGTGPTQYLHPHHHGVGHTKPVGLWLRNLPVVRDTCRVAGRIHAMAALPPTDDRSQRRSRTYLCLAMAMASQWMPSLMESMDTEPKPSALDLVREAAAAKVVRRELIAFCRRGPDGKVQVWASRRRSRLRLLPRSAVDQAGTPNENWPRNRAPVTEYPSAWRSRFGSCLRASPHGEAACTLRSDNAGQLEDVRVWAVELEPSASQLKEPSTAYDWVDADDLYLKLRDGALRSAVSRAVAAVPRVLSVEARKLEQRANETSGSAASASLEHAHLDTPLPASSRPWLVPEEPVEPTASDVRRVAYRHSRWRAWCPVEGSKPPRYEWRPVQPPTAAALNDELRPTESHRPPELPPLPTHLGSVTEGAWTAPPSPITAAEWRAMAKREELHLREERSRLVAAAVIQRRGVRGLLKWRHGRSQPLRSPLSPPSTRQRPEEPDCSTIGGPMKLPPAAQAKAAQSLVQAQRNALWRNKARAARQAPADSLVCAGRLHGLGAGPVGSGAGAYRGDSVPAAATAAKEIHCAALRRLWNGPLTPAAARAPFDVTGVRPHGLGLGALTSQTRRAALPERRLRDMPALTFDERDRAASVEAHGVYSGRGPVLRPRGSGNKAADLRLASLHREEFARFVKSGDEALTSPPSPEVTVAAVLPAEASTVVPDSDFVDETMPTLSRNCLFLRDLVILRGRGRTRFRVDAAAVTPRVLADSGAGPSLVTTELLRCLPSDACVYTRTRGSGPDGGRRIRTCNGHYLALQGTVAISFLLNGVAMTHEFTLVEGAPLMLLGNDFLAEKAAEIQMEGPGASGGRLTLTSAKDGAEFRHSARVTTDAADLGFASPTGHLTPKSCVAAVVPVDAAGKPLPPKMNAATKANHILQKALFDEAPSDESSQPMLPPKPLPKTADEVIESQLRVQHDDYLLYSREAVLLPQRSRTYLRLRLPRSLDGDTSMPCFVHRIPARQGLEDPPNVEPRCSYAEADGFVTVMVFNNSDEPTTIPAYSPVAALDVAFEVHSNPGVTSDAPYARYESLTAEQKALIDQVKLDPQGVLTEEQRMRAKDVMAKHIAMLAVDPKKPTHTHLMDVHLPLKAGAQPHRHAPSRLGEEGRALVEKHVAEMETRGIIRKSNSEWASRVVLVSKKDGSTRFCIDFRDVNSKLQLLDSPIPLVAEAIDRLSTGQGDPATLFLTTLDLAAGFWTMAIDEKSKPLTAFVTHRQKYEFNYLPFGIQSGPSYMCRLIDSALSGLAWDICIPYLDDVATWSTGPRAADSTPPQSLEERVSASFEQMLYRIDVIFERLRWAGLSARADKCVVFAIRAAYLGHEVSRQGLHMDPEKVKKVRELDPARVVNVGDVRSFLGLCSYYRRFIRGFTELASPLHDLTKTGVDVETEVQSAKCQEAIVKLARALTEAPVLAMPQFDREFILKTDAASTKGLGGVLSQVDDEGRERVVAYYGRRLTKHELNYTVTEIELLAAKEAIKHWRPYLWGRKFRLVIDHAALRWLHTMKDTVEGGTASRLMRWIMLLQEYNFTVEHKPGVVHKDADAVSRLVGAVLSFSDEPTDADEHSNAAEVSAAAFQDWMAATTSRNDLYPEESQLLDYRAQVVATALGSGSAPPPDSDAAVVAAAPARRAEVITARSLRAADRLRRAREHSDRASVQQHYMASRAPTLATIASEQFRDPECRKVMAYLITGCDDGFPDGMASVRQAAWLRANARWFSIDDSTGALCRMVPSAADPARLEPRPFVPATLREAMMTAFHEHLGHLGERKMRSVIRSRYYWPTMDKQIAAHVASCHECTLGKPPINKPTGVHVSDLGSYPFDLLFCDVLDIGKTHDYEAATETTEGRGYSKLLVFADSLSRWVEAIPFHGDPTSEQVLDAFNCEIVSRHGVPRALRSDRGTNIASKLAEGVLAQTGADLRPSTAEHHESVGLVEKFNQTLLGLIRVSNEGADRWVDHLPFLLMAYRAAPHRTTGLSPSALLYGREMRLPAQISGAPPTGLRAEGAQPEPAELRYAQRLHRLLTTAWLAARQAAAAGAAHDMAERQRVSRFVDPRYQPDDLVCRLSHDRDNKMAYYYSGPYRVESVSPSGRVKLRDLENRMVNNDFDVSNLRPYRGQVEDGALDADEYVIDYIMDKRTRRGVEEYLVKWRHYPRGEATWEPRSTLAERDAVRRELDQFDAARGAPRPPRPGPAARVRPKAVGGRPAVGPPKPRNRVKTNLGARAKQPAAAAPAPAPPPVAPSADPQLARRRGNVWEYLSLETDRHGKVRTRWHLEQHFAPRTDSLFADLRASSEGERVAHAPTPAPEEVACAPSEPAEAASVADAAEPPAAAPPEVPSATRADAPSRTVDSAKVWFACTRPDHSCELFAYVRRDSCVEKPLFDTLGGRLDPADRGQYGLCVIRELGEEARCHESWWRAVHAAVRAHPAGQRLLDVTDRSGHRHRTAMWLVWLGSRVACHPVRPTRAGLREMLPDTLRWRPLSQVLQNLATFRTWHPVGTLLSQLINLPPPSTQLTAPSTAALLRAARAQLPSLPAVADPARGMALVRLLLPLMDQVAPADRRWPSGATLTPWVAADLLISRESWLYREVPGGTFDSFAALRSALVNTIRYSTWTGA